MTMAAYMEKSDMEIHYCVCYIFNLCLKINDRIQHIFDSQSGYNIEVATGGVPLKSVHKKYTGKHLFWSFFLK